MKNAFLFVIILSFLLLAVSISPFVYRNFVTPPDRIFAGTQFFSDDWGVYVATIRQGFQGRWSVIDKYISEEHQGSLFHIHYLLIGRLARILNINPVLAYHLARLTFGAVFIFATYLFLKECFSNKSINNLPRVPTQRRDLRSQLLTISCLLALFAGGFHYAAIPEPSVFTRFVSQPHFLLGSITVLLIFVWFLRFIKSGQAKYLFFTSFLVFFNTLAEPAILVTALLALGLLGVIGGLGGIGLKAIKRIVLFLVVMTSAALPTAWYLLNLRQIQPWASLAQFDLYQTLHPRVWDWLLSLGPMAFLAPLAFIGIKKNKNSINNQPASPAGRQLTINNLLSFSFLIASFLLIFPFAEPIKINRIRFWHAPAWIASAHLAAVAIHKISLLIYQKVKKDIIIFNFLPLFLLSLIILISLPHAFQNLINQYREYQDFSTLVYPKKTQFQAFEFLQKETHPSQVVLALYEVGSLLPPLAGNTVYVGNVNETLAYWQKSPKATLFFQGQMNETQAKLFLETGNISLIWFGFQEKQYGFNPGTYPFLKLIFDNQEVKIYRYKGYHEAF